VELRQLTGERDALWQQAETAEAQWQELREAHQQENQDLLAEKAQLTGLAKSLLDERKSRVQKIPPELFKEYNGLRAKKSNRPLAALHDKACAVCGIEQNSAVITTIQRTQELVHCQNCGRILVRL